MLSVDDSSLQQEQFQLELQLIAELLMKHVMRLSVDGKRGSNESLRRYGHSRILGASGTPILGGRGGRRGSAMAPFERAMVVSAALSVTFRPQFAIECLQRSNQQGVGHFGPEFPVAPPFQHPTSIRAKISGCSPWSRSMMFGSAESEHPRLTNREIIFAEFQPM